MRNTKSGPFGPCPHLTAQAVQALLDSGLDASNKHVLKALRWLSARQEQDGSFQSLWHRGHTIATAAVVEALCRTEAVNHSMFRRAVDWLILAQRPNGAWSASAGAGFDTVEETASALSALLQSGMSANSVHVKLAAQWLMDRQRSDGTWPAEPVNEYIRFQYRFADETIGTSLAVRALGLLMRSISKG
jgi:squalene-hopene/tetraprenyl-beta-curcumene cyclase